jgi:hypothetical protein
MVEGATVDRELVDGGALTMLGIWDVVASEVKVVLDFPTFSGSEVPGVGIGATLEQPTIKRREIKTASETPNNFLISLFLRVGQTLKASSLLEMQDVTYGYGMTIHNIDLS